MYEKFHEDWKANKVGGTPLVDSALDHFEEGIANAHILAEDAAETAVWDKVDGKPDDFPPAEHVHSYNDLTDKPTIPAEPDSGDAGQLEAGESTANVLWSAQAIHDEIARQVAEAVAGLTAPDEPEA